MARRNKNEEGCCGTCRHYRFDTEELAWMCMNQESDNFVVETEYSDTCIDYEGKRK